MRKIIIKFILLIIFFVAYTFVNSFLYYHGRSNGYFTTHLPFGLKPIYYDLNDGFMLEDKDDFSFIYKNAELKIVSDNSIKIKKDFYTIKVDYIDSYGFSDNKFSLIIESGGKKVKLEFIGNESSYEFSQKNQFSTSDLLDLKWVHVKNDESKVSMYITVSFFLELIIFLFVILLLKDIYPRK